MSMFLGRFSFARRTDAHRNAPRRTGLGMTSGMSPHDHPAPHTLPATRRAVLSRRRKNLVPLRQLEALGWVQGWSWARIGSEGMSPEAGSLLPSMNCERVAGVAVLVARPSST